MNDISLDENTVISFDLVVIPPYDFKSIFSFLGARAIPGVESLVGLTYRRGLRINDLNKVFTGWLEIRGNIDKNVLEVRLSRGLYEVIDEVKALIIKVFDTRCNPKDFPEIIQNGLRLPGAFDLFEMAVRTILGQQITVQAARTLAGRLAMNLGQPIVTPWKEVSRVFPSEEMILELENVRDTLGELGVIAARSLTIYEMAQAIRCGRLDFNKYKHPEELIKNLLSIKGIGPWSAEYLLMRGASYRDAFPVTDLGIKHGLVDRLKDDEGQSLTKLQPILSKYKFDKLYERKALEWSEKYKPWRSYITIGVWLEQLDWSRADDIF